MNTAGRRNLLNKLNYATYLVFVEGRHMKQINMYTPERT